MYLLSTSDVNLNSDNFYEAIKTAPTTLVAYLGKYIVLQNRLTGFHKQELSLELKILEDDFSNMKVEGEEKDLVQISFLFK